MFALRFCSIFLVCASMIYADGSYAQENIFYDVSCRDKVAVKRWLATKPDLTIKNMSGQLILTTAVLSGNWEIVAMLIKAGAPINVIDQYGKTALDYAVERKQVNIARKLVKLCKAGVAQAYNAVILKSWYKQRAIGFFVAGLFLTPLFWIGSAVALSDSSDVWVIS